MNLVCLVVDRLHSGYLGSYGNAWIETPRLDRLAAEGVVFDNCLVDTPRLADVYSSYWMRSHVLERSQGLLHAPSVPKLLADGAVMSVLCTDDAEIAGHPLARDFGEIVSVEARSSEIAMAEVHDTQLARFMAVAADLATTLSAPWCLWLHTQGLGISWDAPQRFRARYVDPEDPPAPQGAKPPCLYLPVDHDPDQVLGACQAYAGQVTLLDKCLGGLIDVLDGLPDSRRTLLVLTGARGFPLGEHHRLGPCDEWLGAELVHVPLLLRFGDGSGALGRNACFVQPADLGETVLDWFEIAIRSPAAGAGNLLSNVRGDSVSLRDRAVVALADRHAIRTSAWYSQSLVGQTESHDSAQTTWLYAKPDDRWEQNDVADRCPDVVQALATAYNSFAEHALAGSLNELPPMETNLKLEW